MTITNMTIEAKANAIADAMHHVMGDELGLQTPVRYLLMRDGDFIFVMGVMDAQNLHGSIHKYRNDDLLHQLSTAVADALNGEVLPVALSNHSGLRYAVSMTKPRLPKVVEFPTLLSPTVTFPQMAPDGRNLGEVGGRDVIPFGVSLRGAVHLHARKMVNMIVGGSQDSGKSTTLRLLAHVNRAYGSQLYLADPHMHTFNPDVWNQFTAMPVAGKRSEVLQLIEAMQAEIENRSALFRAAAVRGIPPNDIDEYNEIVAPPPTPPHFQQTKMERGESQLPRVWLIGDEMNAFMGERVVQERMAELARGGRKWGVHVVLAAHTWRKEDIPSSVSAMFPTRLCLRVADSTSGPVTLGDSRRGKEPMKFRTAGRAVLFAVGQYQKIQLYYVPPEMEREWLGSGISPTGMLRDDQLAVSSVLPEEEAELVGRSLDKEGGRFTQGLLQLWGLGPREARSLLERYEARGWVEQDPKRSNGRYITEKLAVLVTNRQTRQTTSNPQIGGQTPDKPRQTPDMAVA